jgi:tetratricopeptide (TPR) repeat protein
LAAKNIKIFIASASEVKAERDKAVLMLNHLSKSHRHLQLEPVEWEYDIVPGNQPGYNTVQGAIDQKLTESHLVVFIFYSRIGQYTREEFELAARLNKKVFAFCKTGFSPTDEAEIEAYSELMQFKSSLNSTILHQQYDDVDDFDKLLYRSLNLYLAENYSVAELVQLPAEVLTLVRLLGEKEERIKELEGLLQATSGNTEVQQLTTEIDAIRAQLTQSEELHQQQAADKAALEQQLASQKDNDQLKAQALEALEKGDYAAAETLLRESANDSITDAAATFYELGKLKRLQLQYRAAFEYYELAATIKSNKSLYLHDAGSIAWQLGYFDRAICYYEKSLALEIASYGLRHPEIATLYCNIGLAYAGKGWYEKAIDQYKQALSIDYEYYGERHPVIAINYNNLGAAYLGKPEYNEAVKYYKLALDISKEFYSDRHPLIATIYNNLGEVYRKKDKIDVAIDYLLNALDICKEFHKEQHPGIANCYVNLGAAYSDKEDYDTAISYYDRALAINKSLYDELNPEIAKLYNNLGEAYRGIGEIGKAIDYYQQAIDIGETLFRESHPDIAIRYNNLGLAYTTKANYDIAISYFEKALSIQKKFYQKQNPDIAIVYSNLGFAYYWKREYDIAIDYFVAALPIFEAFLPPTHVSIVKTKTNLQITIEAKAKQV